MSTGLDDDTLQTVQSGRETIGTMLRAAQKHLQKVFIVWVVGLLITIMALQNFLWDMLQRDLLYAKMDLTQAQATKIIATTPFDVILLQVKIGAVVGILMALPLLLYYSRDPLRERGWWPDDEVATWKLWSLFGISLALFAGGVVYAYELFFPLMFDFLAGNARQAGFKPHYSIVKWFGFVALLAFSFGLAAQLPLLMSTLSFTGIVPYETFRDNWKWAVVIIFAFGALFSPPDPFTQVMWAAPLVGLYAISLGISKLLVLTKRAGEEIEAGAVARVHWNKLAGAAVLVGGLVYYLLATEAFAYVQTGAELFPSDRLTGDIAPPAWFGLSAEATAAIIAVGVGLLAALVVLYYYMIRQLDVAAKEAGHFGDPAELDLEPLSAEAVRSAPPEVFEEMEEHEALRQADSAMSDDDPEKAQVILDRFDAVQEREAERAEEADASGDGEEEDENVFTSTTAGVFNAFSEEETTEDDIGGYYHDIAFIVDSLASKAFWLVGTFMLIAGVTFVFLYTGIPGAAAAPLLDSGTVVGADGAVVADNVTVVADNVTVFEGNQSAQNRSIVETGVLLTSEHGGGSANQATAVMDNESRLVRNASVYNGTVAGGDPYVSDRTVLVQNETTVDTTSGIGLIKNAFVSKLPPQMQSDVAFITLHPVEHLIFIVKFSTILGIVSTFPLLAYFAWPALKERGFVSGDRDMMGAWGGTVILTLVTGTVFGFLFIAPNIVSWLARDVLNSGMLISYRVAKFGWLILALTVGIGLLVEIPITMLLFHRGGIVTFQTIQERWKTVTLGVFAASALFSPKGILTMFIIAIPVTVFFLIGFALLWLLTLGGRRPSKGSREVAD